MTYDDWSAISVTIGLGLLIVVAVLLLVCAAMSLVYDRKRNGKR